MEPKPLNSSGFSPPPRQTASPQISESSRNVGAIAGGVVGGFAGLSVLVALLFFLRRRRRHWQRPVSVEGPVAIDAPLDDIPPAPTTIAAVYAPLNERNHFINYYGANTAPAPVPAPSTLSFSRGGSDGGWIRRLGIRTPSSTTGSNRTRSTSHRSRSSTRRSEKEFTRRRLATREETEPIRSAAAGQTSASPDPPSMRDSSLYSLPSPNPGYNQPEVASKTPIFLTTGPWGDRL
jgi:hypothetical protein